MQSRVKTRGKWETVTHKPKTTQKPENKNEQTSNNHGQKATQVPEHLQQKHKENK